MNYHLISTRGKKKPYRNLLIAATLILVLIILDSLSFSFTSRVVQTIAAPLLKTENTLTQPFQGFFAYFASKRSLEEENRRLKEHAELMRLEALNARTLLAENTELKKLLGREVDVSKNILAVVLLKPSFTPYDTLIVDVGNDVGVEVHNRVVVAGIPVGRVMEVYPHSSLVKLYSSAGEEFQVLIGERYIEATAKGQGGGSFEIALPKDVEVKKGDLISIPSIITNTFALVEEIHETENESFKYVYFRSPVSISEMKWVYIQK